MTETTRIAEPYDPEALAGQFGWLRADIDGSGTRWNLIATFYDGDDLWCRFIEPDAQGAEALLELADVYRDRQFLPLVVPDCLPTAQWWVAGITSPGVIVQHSAAGSGQALAAAELMKAFHLIKG